MTECLLSDIDRTPSGPSRRPPSATHPLRAWRFTSSCGVLGAWGAADTLAKSLLRWQRILPLGAGALTASLLAVRFGPAALLTLGLGLPASPQWAGESPSPAEVVIETNGARRLQADLYPPHDLPRGGLVLVHGLSPAGRRHPELARLARLLARRGHAVLVPHLGGLAAYRLGGTEVEEIAAAIRHVARLGTPPGVAGFSFGAGPALLAAAAVPEVRLAASFGGYADLRRVITFVTTGSHGFGGHRYHGPQEDYNRWKLLALLAGFAEDGRDRERLRAVAGRRLANPGDDTTALEARLGREGRAILALVRNRRAEAAEALLAGLPDGARRSLARLSPLGAVAAFRGRLLVAHGAHDPSIPFTESLRLAAAAPGRVHLAILEGFHHTGPRAAWDRAGETLRDAWALFRLADALLRP